MELFGLLLPECLLVLTALVLFMFGVTRSAGSRRAVPWIALVGVFAAFIVSATDAGGNPNDYGRGYVDWTGSLLVSDFSRYLKLVSSGIGILFVLLSWPTNKDATGNSALRYGLDAGEYFGLLVLSLAGLLLCASANDTILLFLGIELASIPTYVMVAMSRPLPQAQEAGVKYFYLGAMSAAVMLLGFAYLYGITGTTNLYDASRILAGEATGSGVLASPGWKVLAIALVVLGFCYKMAAVPLHFYAGDVYQGAATPVTALLSFVPKTVGIIATIKILYAVGGNNFMLPEMTWKLLFAVAVLTMTVGNLLALMQHNLKRMMAYSSVAHSGYMLVALTALAAAGLFGRPGLAETALAGVLFYIAAYGIMNAGVFGVLLCLPTRQRTTDRKGNVYRLPATSAETFDDIAGVARRRPLLAAAMTICCLSLIGIPLTVGFVGKLYVLAPVLRLAGVNPEMAPEASPVAMQWLAGITLVNAAISAGYYLRVVAVMTLRPSPEQEDAEAEGRAYDPTADRPALPWPLTVATSLSAAGTLFFGAILPAVQLLSNQTGTAAIAPQVRMDRSAPAVVEEQAAAEGTLIELQVAATEAGR